MSATVPDQLPVPATLPPLMDNEFIIGQLVRITGQDRAEVEERFDNEQQELGWNVRQELARWQLAPHVWNDRLVEFYQHTDAFLFETICWNRTVAKHKIRSWIGQFMRRSCADTARVLTFGDGLGIDSLFLSQAGYAVDYFEVSDKCVRFANSLAERSNCPLNVLDHKDKIPLGAYEAVLCLDVLEHVPNPCELVRELTEYLKPGGFLIVHAPFWFIDSSVATHLASNRKFSGDLRELYQSAGLKVVDASFLWSPIVLEKTKDNASPNKMPHLKQITLQFSRALLILARYWNWPLVMAARQTVRNRLKS